MIKYVLFDLDGTLLPMDQDLFVDTYFKGLATKMVPYGYDPKQLIKTVWAGTAAMIKNDGSQSNEDAFWNVFTSVFGPDSRSAEPVLETFYQVEFQNVQKVCGYTEKAAELIRQVKAQGLIPVLATNPIFPQIATFSRIRWAGLETSDFALITTYENSRFSKPNPAYYQDILNTLGTTADQCIMVGNDVGDDMVAQKLGMQVFLLTDCLINKTETDISQYPNGDFSALMTHITKL